MDLYLKKEVGIVTILKIINNSSIFKIMSYKEKYYNLNKFINKLKMTVNIHIESTSTTI